MNNKVLWLTSFTPKLHEVSGKHMLDSFYQHKIHGQMFVGYEDFPQNPELPFISNYKTNLDKSNFLKNWLERNADIIPKDLGGKGNPCQCPDAFARNERDHRERNCHHTWFNRNASRWFRKIATLHHAINYLIKANNKSIEYIIWIDCDCLFQQELTFEKINKWFSVDPDIKYDVLYLKNRRPVLEGGFVGYAWNETGKKFIDAYISFYINGTFRRLKRWDDCYTLQKVMDITDGINTCDLAYSIDTSDHSGVFSKSKLKHYIMHNKGLHGRQKGIMK